ncbi:luciferin sulfotransferase isoform X1 [Anastrepha obliqua]|uniref:luciferin sulfotransferase isoform X1 n=1 Tax=Anastrepha obliqua TaxID=95512 RepID=UPI002409C29B|nr:luciferin sulfotransferase isoform X1 [Anastrepha obliqua]
MQLTFKELDKDIAVRIDALFPKKECFIEVLPGHVVLPRKFMNISESIRDLPIYEDDVWMISYPRTGSTWAQEMIWLLGNKLDFEGAKQMQQLRSPLIELSALFSEDHHEWVTNSIGNTVNVVRDMPRPRFGRSHLTLDLLPRGFETVKPKIIYTARNPKDLCVSFYYYCKLVHGLKGPFDDFLDLFLDERSPMGSYWNHVLPFWHRRNEPNILFLKYEDMKRDLPKIVRRCAEFLDIDYQLTDEDLTRICEHLKFDKMQMNPAVNLEPLLKNVADGQNNNSENVNNGERSKFIRKGEIGDWRNYFSTDATKRFDEWIERNCKGSELVFEYQ